MCAVAVAALLGCDQGAEGEGSNQSSASACATEAFDSTWWNQAFPEQTGMFHVEFTATPSAANMDAVIGLANGPASKWTSLAAIVRFNPQGLLDARDGGTYRADRSLHYEAGHRYWFRFDVDVATHRYSVWTKTWEGSAYYPLARDYNFRTEQLAVTRLTNTAAFVNPETSAQGSLEVCGVTVTKDNTTADGCTANVAGGGFVNTPIAASSNVQIVRFRARPLQANMDGVVGIANGDVDAYDDFAASIRFWTNGKVEVRDGDVYRADRDIPYAAGEEFDVRMIIDLASHTYSVYVYSPNIDPYWESHVRIASGYKFRPAQARVASLDRVTSVVASSTGRLDACEIAGGPHPPVIAIRDDAHDVLPLADGGALIASATKTTRLDANNVPVGSVDGGGQVAIDGAGSYYVASVDTGVLAVRSYTPAFAPRWTVNYAVSGTAFVQDMVIAPNGEAVLAIGSRDGWGNETPLYLVRLGSDGHYIANQTLPQGTTAVGLGPTMFVVARALEGTVAYEQYAYGNWTSWSRLGYVDGNYTVTRIAVAPDGSFVVAGRLGGAVTFGAQTIEPYSNSDFGTWDAFVAAFSPEMFVRFAERRWTEVTGLATTGSEIAVADEQWTQLQWLYYTVFDTAGNPLRGSAEDAFVHRNGRPGTVALARSGRLYMNVFAPIGGMNDVHHWFLVTLSP